MPLYAITLAGHITVDDCFDEQGAISEARLTISAIIKDDRILSPDDGCDITEMATLDDMTCSMSKIFYSFGQPERIGDDRLDDDEDEGSSENDDEEYGNECDDDGYDDDLESEPGSWNVPVTAEVTLAASSIEQASILAPFLAEHLNTIDILRQGLGQSLGPIEIGQADRMDRIRVRSEASGERIAEAMKGHSGGLSPKYIGLDADGRKIFHVGAPEMLNEEVASLILSGKDEIGPHLKPRQDSVGVSKENPHLTPGLAESDVEAIALTAFFSKTLRPDTANFQSVSAKVEAGLTSASLRAAERGERIARRVDRIADAILIFAHFELEGLLEPLLGELRAEAETFGARP